MNLPAEALEMEAPVRLIRVALRRDSGGPGEFRGGLGVVREYEVLGGRRDFYASRRAALQHCVRPERRRRRRFRPVRAYCVRTGAVRRFRRKSLTVLQRGDRVIVETPGGGGYGDPRARKSVAEDVAGGKVSREAARVVYGAAHRVTRASRPALSCPRTIPESRTSFAL